MVYYDLKVLTKRFALDVAQMLEAPPPTRTSDVIAKQLLRSAASVGANYRAACRARSQVDSISKITIVEEEADESVYWLELLSESGQVPHNSIADLIREANELTAIFTAAGRTAKGKR